jgi:hypothetical protein
MRFAKLPLLRLDQSEEMERAKMARRCFEDRAVGSLGAAQIPLPVKFERALE